ncbi:MAG: type II secretion system protein GspG [Patescibacteria group bacterium]|nr:type II secretion system protein GspG [Patescibacteria group bacterium]
MTNINQTPSSKSVAGWIFGGLSFIPLIGVLFGIIAIIIGLIKKTRGQIFLGICGILVTVFIYGSLYYFGFVAQTGIYADLKIKLASQLISTDAGQISLYKSQHGRLPVTLNDLGVPSQTNMFFASDPWGTPFSYTPESSGHFELRSAGPDKILNTADDIKQTF